MADHYHVSFGEDETYRGILLKLFQEEVEEGNRHQNKYASRCAMAAAIVCILLGFEIGIMSEATTYIKADLQLSKKNDDFWLAISKLFSLIGSVLAGSTSNRISSRIKIVLGADILVIGALFMIIGPGFFYLVLGRLIINIGVGYVLTIAPVYIVEISPTFYRGLLTSFPEVFMNGGTLLAYISYYFFSRMSTELARSYLLCLGGIALGLVAFGVLAMPESPQWLVKQGRVEDARGILARISDSEEEAALRFNEIISQTNGEGLWQAIIHPTQSILHMSLCVFGIYLFQQVSGIDTILLYSARIFEQIRIVNYTKQLLLLILVDFVKTMFTLVCAFNLDQVGRRRLMLISIGGMILSLASLGVCLTIIHQHSYEKIKWASAICILSLLCYTASFSVGMGPIALVYSSEIFPMRLRAQGCAIGVAVGQVASGLMSMMFMILYSVVTLGGAVFLFMGMAMVAWVFLYLLMPETKGKSLEEITQLFGSWTAWSSATTTNGA